MSLRERIEAANREAVSRMVAARPLFTDVRPARDVVPGMGPHDIHHAGPPVSWEHMSGAQKGAVTCAILFEGWASKPDGARELAATGGVRLVPNHERGGVGPMAGVVSPSMPVFVAEEPGTGRRAYAALEEPRMNFGAYDAAALDLRFFWRDVLGPALAVAARERPVDLTRLIARALHRGDEMHNRPAAATSLLIAELAPALIRSSLPRETVTKVLDFVHEDEIFFLSLSMAAAKLQADAAHGVPDSTVVTCMARNGTDFGIRVSGLGDRWFVAPSPTAKGLFLPGFSEADAGRDMGDSAITETVGLGGMVLVSAPAIFEMVGANASQAFGFAREMREITVLAHPLYTLPILDFEGAPTGIDVRKVVDTGLLPVIDTAIAHREPGHPIIGAGLVRPPMACFVSALEAFAADRGIV